MTSPALELSGIEKSFDGSNGPITVLRGVDLTLLEGECLCVVGPSGSGKTTLLNVCGLLVAADAGSRHIRGVDVTALTEDEEADLRFSTIGFCFQGFLLSPTLSARENVMLPGLPRRLDFDPRIRAAELLDQVGLTDRADHLPSQLSGGEQQRVALARSLFAAPPIVLIDEPTANLDRAAAHTIAELLARLRADDSRALLVATHDPLVIGVADRVLALEDGRLAPTESDLFRVKHEL